MKMSNTDYRLGQWFKELEKKEKELKAKKHDNAKLDDVLKSYIAQESSQNSSPKSESSSNGTPIESSEATKEMTYNLPKTESNIGSVSVIDADSDLYDSADVPDIDDFISFDNTKSKVKESEYEDKIISSSVIEKENLTTISEGTGVPKPLELNSTEVTENKPQVREIEDLLKDADSFKKTESAPDITVKKSVEKVKRVDPVLNETGGSIKEKWDRMPHHLQILFGTTDSEIAQGSYKKFKENRGVLIERLLDPSISLEETARILHVCPTTVRRYTNKGTLKHFRTAGNQRRFKLSDVLSFLETNNPAN
jgi:excisionase family DNA binding protein